MTAYDKTTLLEFRRVLFRSDEYEGRFQNADLFVNYTPRESLMLLAGTNLQKSAVPERKALELPQLSADFISPYASILYRNRSGLRSEEHTSELQSRGPIV